MSLNWNLEDIKDWESVCRDDDGKQSPVTHALIMVTMGLDLPGITEANVDEFAWRLDMYQRMFGPLLVGVENDEFVKIPVTTEDVRAHVGLATNVSPVSRAKWLKRMTDLHYMDFVRDHREKERA
jgi:hypothetical protein